MKSCQGVTYHIYSASKTVINRTFVFILNITEHEPGTINPFD